MDLSGRDFAWQRVKHPKHPERRVKPRYIRSWCSQSTLRLSTGELALSNLCARASSHLAPVCVQSHANANADPRWHASLDIVLTDFLDLYTGGLGRMAAYTKRVPLSFIFVGALASVLRWHHVNTPLFAYVTQPLTAHEAPQVRLHF